MNGPADVNDRIHIWLLHHFATREVTTYVDLLRQRNTDWDFQSIPGRVQSGYRHRLRLYLSTWPGLICYGIKQVFRALHADRRKLILVGWSHLTILPVLLMNLIIRNPPQVVLYGFIYTERKSRILNWLRWFYFRLLLTRVSLAICHSQHECQQYREWFPRGTRFAYVPFCMNVIVPDGLTVGNYAISAGRSGRDYPLLIRAFAELAIPLKIVCDYHDTNSDSLPPNVEILSQTYGGDYLRVLGQSRLVVLPLAVKDVSAGQMVMIQAMALGKPIIVTRTTTIEEYATDGCDCILVTMGDESDLKNSVRAVWENSQLQAELGANALATYKNRFSIESEAQYFIGSLQTLVGSIGDKSGRKSSKSLAKPGV